MAIQAAAVSTQQIYIQIGGSIEPIRVHGGVSVRDEKREDSQGRDASIWRVLDCDNRVIGEFTRLNTVGWWFGE